MQHPVSLPGCIPLLIAHLLIGNDVLRHPLNTNHEHSLPRKGPGVRIALGNTDVIASDNLHWLSDFLGSSCNHPEGTYVLLKYVQSQDRLPTFETTRQPACRPAPYQRRSGLTCALAQSIEIFSKAGQTSKLTWAASIPKSMTTYLGGRIASSAPQPPPKRW